MDARPDIKPEVTFRIIGSAMKVHRGLGGGLLESTYRRCLQHQLHLDGFGVRSEVPIPIEYEGLRIDGAYRADLVIDGEILLELKAVDAVLPIHSMQVVTYLKLARLPIGLLINFNVPRLIDGVHRFLNPDLCRQPSPP